MTVVKSTKPSRPRPDFPLFPHSSGQWAKKIKGRVVYFGVWADPDGAEHRFNREQADLYAGRKPRVFQAPDVGVDVAGVCNKFLAAKKDLVEAGELKPRTWDDYLRTCHRITRVFGRRRVVSDLRADDFAELRRDIARTNGPVATGNEISRTRSVFKFAYESHLLDKPIRYGPAFKRPSAKTIRVNRAQNGKRMFTPEQMHTLLQAASPHMRAMLLLAINCGFGNSDVAQLRERHVASGWVDFPRPTTGVERRVKLWPETVDAIRTVLAKRPVAKAAEDRDLLFVTKYRFSWFKDTPGCPISREFRKLAVATGVYRRGLTFYAVRHTHATVAGETGDQVAANAIMGHVDPTMAARYREHISDQRLEAVASHVHAWLFGGAK